MIKAHRMRARLIATVGTALTILCAGLLASAQPAHAATYVPISGAGSTWSYNAINQWDQDVNQYGITVNYTADGSTAGRQLFAQARWTGARRRSPTGSRTAPATTRRLPGATPTCRTRLAARRSCTTCRSATSG